MFDNSDDSFIYKVKPEYAALAVLPVILWFVYNVATMSNHYEQNKERLKMRIENEYNDVVIEKGRMQNNRNLPYLKLSKSEAYNEDELIWSKIEEGDSLLKAKGTSILIIKKKDTIIKADYKDVYKYWDSIYRDDAKR